MAPFTPHVCEELWVALGHEPGIFHYGWPGHDEKIAKAEEIEYAFQVNGKVRARVTVGADTSKDDLEKFAHENEQVKTFVEGKKVIKTIVVPGKLVNIVVKG